MACLVLLFRRCPLALFLQRHCQIILIFCQLPAVFQRFGALLDNLSHQVDGPTVMLGRGSPFTALAEQATQGTMGASHATSAHGILGEILSQLVPDVGGGLIMLSRRRPVPLCRQQGAYVVGAAGQLCSVNGFAMRFVI